MQALTLFYSYVPEDEQFRHGLEKRLSLLRHQGIISEWHNRLITPGTNWSQEIDHHLERASIILLLISPDFLNSDYHYHHEMQRALERHRAEEAHVIPIILRPTDLHDAPFADLECLPNRSTALTQCADQDWCFHMIAQRIREIAENFYKRKVPREEIVLVSEESFETERQSVKDKQAVDDPIVLDNPIAAKKLELDSRSSDGKRFKIPQARLGISMLNFEVPEAIDLFHFEEGSFIILLGIDFADPPGDYAGFAALMPSHTLEPLYRAQLEKKDSRRIQITNIEGRIKRHEISAREGMFVLLIVERCRIILEDAS